MESQQSEGTFLLPTHHFVKGADGLTLMAVTNLLPSPLSWIVSKFIGILNNDGRREGGFLSFVSLEYF